MRTLFLIALTILIAKPATAQQGFFVSAGYSYSWAASSAADIRFNSPVRFGAPNSMWSDDYIEMSGGSFAAGQSVCAEIDYRLSERLGLSLGGHYVFAPRTWEQLSSANSFFPRLVTKQRQRAESPLFLEPGIKLFIPLGARAEAHIRLGALLPVRHSIHTESIIEDTAFHDMLWQSSTQLRTRFSIGGFGGVGLTRELGSGFGLFLQGDFGLLSLRARDEVVESLVGPAPDHENLLPQLEDWQRAIHYFDERPHTFNSSLSQPSYRPTYAIPFNFWSAAIGLRLALE